MRKALVPCAALLVSMAGMSTAFAGPCLTLATADDTSGGCTVARPYAGGAAGFGSLASLPANTVAVVLSDLSASQLAAGLSSGLPGTLGILAMEFGHFAPLVGIAGGYGGPAGGGKGGGNGKGSGGTPGTGPQNNGTGPIQLVGDGPGAGNGGGGSNPHNDPPVGAVPEPGALALLAAGLTGLAGIMALRRRL